MLEEDWMELTFEDKVGYIETILNELVSIDNGTHLDQKTYQQGKLCHRRKELELEIKQIMDWEK